MKRFYVILLAFALSACAAKTEEISLYEAIGGQPVVVKIVDNFINEIGFDRQVFPYFADSDLGRFREKMTEHVCFVAGGPCEYTGDTMLDVHANMDINEADFNQTVDLLIAAMDRAGVPHRLQNRFIQRLVPMREDILYR